MNTKPSTERSQTDGANSTTSRIVEFDQQTESTTEAIATAVADLDGTSPTALEPLFSVVDSDSLDGLVRSMSTRSSTSSAEITFRYQGYTITVHSFGVVEIGPGDGN